MRTAVIATVLGIAAATSGCVHSTVELLAPSRYAATTADSVVVYISVADVAAQHLAYDRVAMLFIRADAHFTKESAIMRRAREDAAKLGANGIILGETREPTLLSTDRQAHVLAIRTRPQADSTVSASK